MYQKYREEIFGTTSKSSLLYRGLLHCVLIWESPLSEVSP